MAKVIFCISDVEDGQAVDCEARCDDPTQTGSMALIIAAYIAANWVGLVQAARLAHNTGVLREGKSLAQEEELRKPPGLVDERGVELPPVFDRKLDRMQ